MRRTSRISAVGRQRFSSARVSGRIDGMKLLLVWFLVAGAVILSAQPAPVAPERAFDFWVGDWIVTDQSTGKVAGMNVIALRHGARVLHEDYTTGRGISGQSLSAWDASRQEWHQCWMDNSGLVLNLTGGPRDGAMVLSGETIGPAGARTRERVTWTPNPDGTVRQHWEQSTDGGQTWKTIFDGLYRRRGTA
jgi:hypothetical protein